MPDAEGFETFYLGSRDRLTLQVAALTGDAAEAFDHVQEAFVRAWRKWDRIREYDEPEAWVRRVALNLAVSRWRRARRIIATDPLDGGVHLDPEQSDLVDALRRLPKSERTAIVLHHLVGYSVDEVAAELHVPTGTVKSWLWRGRVKLAKWLREEREESNRDAG